MMISDPLFPVARLSERRGRAARGMPVTFGCPVPRGQCFNHRKLALVNAQGDEVPAAVSVTALWPDNSIQWCLIHSQVSLAAGEELGLGLSRRITAGNLAENSTPVIDDGQRLTILTGAQTFSVDTRQFRLFASHKEALSGHATLGYAGRDITATVDSYDYRTLQSCEGVLCIQVNLRGVFALDQHAELQYHCALRFAADGTRVDGSLTLHNPAAARHPDGLWDLGDSNSVFLDSLKVGLQRDEPRDGTGGVLLLDPDGAPQRFTDSATVTQLASGGEHWHSPVHVDHAGKVNLDEPGYIASIDGNTQRGKRADPLLRLDGDGLCISVRQQDFWQRFPSQIAATPKGIELGFFPQTGETHELQAGERSTHRFSVCFERADSPDVTTITAIPDAKVVLNSDYVQACALPELGDPGFVDPRIQSIIDEGLSDKSGFFTKREAIDEYGWRHFGDLWADHETEGTTSERLFVSHYNNQYDPLFGFLRQYLTHSDHRWFELARDLARHTVDIDIYNTDRDRPEYNHGLFWHTDHYLHAETSSHRSYSKRQPKNAYEGHARGGGPGGQHCYTTGLLYHYLLTGEESYREALYDLKDWISCVYEGSDTLANVVLAVKNRHRPDLKNHLTGQYPLDRGVANYLHALMDCYALDRAPTTLTQLAAIISHTVHPRDDLAARELDDVEERWYYIVLLQAIGRYLELKADLEQTDGDFLYARDCLVHYAKWMVDNEAPYLDKPDILEFPNQTWTAQDLRKVNVLFMAARWSPDQHDDFCAKAIELREYIATTLANEPSRHYTRILALLMQNAYPTCALPTANIALPESPLYASPTDTGLLIQSANLGRLVYRALRRFRLRREVATARRLLPRRQPQETES